MDFLNPGSAVYCSILGFTQELCSAVALWSHPAVIGVVVVAASRSTSLLR